MRAAGCALALLALLPACRVASREALLRPQLAQAVQAADLAALAAVRGADPLVWQTWAASASVAGTPEAALELIERGLQFLPGHPDLTWMQVSLCAQLGQRARQVAAADEALGRAPPAMLVPELLVLRLDAQLAQDDLPRAESEALALGAVADDPRAVSSAWAAIALAHELRGAPEAADAALERSLAGGPHGLPSLRQQAGPDRARGAAAAALVQRAGARHPQHPDVQFQLAVQATLDGQAEAARTALHALPEPLPSRLVPDREALLARIDLLQDRVGEAWQRLLPVLDADPGAPGPLAVLLECWKRHGQPAPEEVRARLLAARGRVADPGLAAALGAALRELEAPPGEPAPAPAAD